MAFINFSKEDYCRGCQKRYPKELKLHRCLKCNRLLHKKARTPGTRRKKRLENIPFAVQRYT